MSGAVPKQRQLAPKETKLFRELLVDYEQRAYKKGVKTADTILKKYPEHGGSLALVVQLFRYDSSYIPALLEQKRSA